MNTIEKVRIGLCLASGVNPDVDHYKPYWTRMAEAVVESGKTDPKEIAFVLCHADGVDPEKESVGLGSRIARDRKYQLWEAWEDCGTVVSPFVERDQPAV